MGVAADDNADELLLALDDVTAGPALPAQVRPAFRKVEQDPCCFRLWHPVLWLTMESTLPAEAQVSGTALSNNPVLG